MIRINPMSTTAVSDIPPAPPGRTPPDSALPAHGRDRAEFSPQSLAGHPNVMPTDSRWMLIDRVRHEITQGEYETQEKLAVVVSRIANDLFDD